MIKVENVDVWGFMHAIRGMRNPMNSWDKSDSFQEDFCSVVDVGPNDITLMRKLYKAGHPHRKYLRQIFVSMDITAPLYWWKEFDTYKVGTTANSCSTMHKIHAKEFELDDFSTEHLLSGSLEDFCNLLVTLNKWRTIYLEGNSVYPVRAKKVWWQMIQLLPSSYNQKRTITMNYENVFNILDYRQGHKLDEWNIFCEKLKKLPYVSYLEEDLQNGNK